MPKKKHAYELLEGLGFKLDPQQQRIKKDRKSGNNTRRRPKGQRGKTRN